MVVAAAVTGASFIPRHSDRKDVAAYIEHVNKTGTAFATQYKDINKAYQSFGTTGKSTQAERLRAAARRLSQLRLQLAQIPAPKQAARLRARLVAFYRLQESVAFEIAAISTYFPALVATEKPLAGAAKRMQASVRKASTPAAQADVLGAYADELGTAARSVGRLDAPTVLAAAQQAEVARLSRLERSVRAVERALRTHDRPALQKAVNGLAFDGTAAAKATRAGVLAYNRHVRQIGRMAVRVEQERRRLDASLS